METMIRLCGDDCWTGVIDDPAPRAIRWARRELAREKSPAWSKYHYTEGNGLFTACGGPVVLFGADGSPQEHELGRVDCNRCLARMKPREQVAVESAGSTSA